MRHLFVGIAIAMALAGCSKSQKTTHVGREFRAMADCLKFIEGDIGESLNVITDKPGDVSGKSVVNGLFFRCEAKMTGTRGLVLEGRWDRLKK